MTRTAYEAHNGAFTDRAHMAARNLIYPRILGVPQKYITYDRDQFNDSERGRILDGQLGIDLIVRQEVPGLRTALPYSVQERFRRMKFRGYQDVTITSWNNASDMPSELHKMCCDWFVYAYFDEHDFWDVTVMDVHKFKNALRRGDLGYTTGKNKKQQDFLCFKINELRSAGVLAPLYDWSDIAAYETAVQGVSHD